MSPSSNMSLSIAACLLWCFIVKFAAVRGLFVNSSLGAFSPLPIPVKGTCTAGRQYTINSIDDLQRHIGDLDCIFAAGVAPSADTIPLGYSYGTLLTFLNSGLIKEHVDLAYQGHYVVSTRCHRQNYTIGWLSISGVNVGTALLSVGRFPYSDNLASGEYPLGNREGVIMDFSVDFSKLCGAEGSESSLGIIGLSPFSNSVWPFSQISTYARVVGRDASDGGLIMLNKAYITPAKLPLGASTISFYATKNFDPLVLRSFANPPPQIITVPAGPSGEQEINYLRGGIESLIVRLDPKELFSLPSGVVDDVLNALESNTFSSFGPNTAIKTADLEMLTQLFATSPFNFTFVPKI